MLFLAGRKTPKNMERNKDNEQSCPTSHPYDSASLLSCLTLHWMNTVLKLGSQRPLEKEDIFPVRTQDSMEHLVNKLEKLWQQEINRSRLRGCQPRLWRAFSRMFSKKQYIAPCYVRRPSATATLVFPLGSRK